MKLSDVPIISKKYSIVNLKDRILAIPKNSNNTIFTPVVIGGAGYYMLNEVNGINSVRDIIQNLSQILLVDRSRMESDILDLFSELEKVGLLCVYV